jgi:hypothetical protein
MMKLTKCINLATAAILFAAGSAYAVTHNITLSADVQGACAINTTPTVSVGGAIFTNITTAASTFNVNISNGSAVVTSGTLTIPFSCNGSSMRVTLDPKGTAIKHVTAASGGGMNNEINYSATLKSGGDIFTINTNISKNPQNSVRPAGTQSIDIQITSAATTNLIAGAYTGTLEVKIDAI